MTGLEEKVMTKKAAVIVVNLVPEADEKTNEELANDIREATTDNISTIPWAAKVVFVKVSEPSAQRIQPSHFSTSHQLKLAI